MPIRTIQHTDGDIIEQHKPLVIVGCYTRFNNLAHRPRGTEATHPVMVYQLDPENGSLMLLNAFASSGDKEVMNPAFFRAHPTRNIVYGVTESIEEAGEVIGLKVDPTSGSLRIVGRESAGGSSTCYLTVDHDKSSMLLVNYWDSTMGVMPLLKDGSIKPLKTLTYPEKKIEKVDAFEKRAAGKHDLNDAATQAQRQSEPHAHAIVLEPIFGRIAYVPDLGEDCIHQYLYSPEDGSLKHTARLECGLKGQGPHGPRYIEFHTAINVAYVVNELGCTISVFNFDLEAATDLVNGKRTDVKTLNMIQSISTVPAGYSSSLNTCSRVALHPSQRFLFVGNRGHDSIAVFKVHSSAQGRLSHVSFFHTRGRCPRHFQFDKSGQWLVAANQDSDSIVVFNFNQSSGKLDYTGNEVKVPSPNFVCLHTPYVSEEGNDTYSKYKRAAIKAAISSKL